MMKVGDIVTIPVIKRRTFWQWLMRKPVKEVRQHFKITYLIDGIDNSQDREG